MPTLFQTGNIRILVYRGDHSPMHVHVVTRDRSLEEKKTTAKHTRRALNLCSDNLEILKEGAKKYYVAQ